MPLDNTYSLVPNEVDETTSLLIRARGFLERGWCRGWMAAHDVDGNRVDPQSDRAVAWCAYGALVAAGMPRDGECWKQPAMCRLGEVLGVATPRISRFNDEQETVEPVLAAFDRAIAMGREGAPTALHPSKTEG